MKDKEGTIQVERLDKRLANAGVGSRKEVRQLIKAGRVTVNDRKATNPGMQVPGDAQIQVDSQDVFIGSLTVMLNKPTGLVTARQDALHGTVLDLFPPALARRLFPVGRLDKDSEGLLLLTDDGQLSHRLISPRYGIEKEYLVTVDGPIPMQLKEDFSQGVTLRDGTETLPAQLHIVKADAPGIATLTIREGKYHQVRRMFAWANLHVTKLRRVRIGSLTLPEDLAPGSYKTLTEAEIALLYDASCNI